MSTKSCAQVHELPQNHCGDNWEGTLFSLGFTPCQAEQPLQGMELQEKQAKVNRCLLILDLKPFKL